MKRIMAWLLVLAALAGLVGCGSATGEVSGKPQAPVAIEAAATTEPTVAPTTQPPVLEGALLLKVASITFSLVGESEDIYLGVLPREVIAWESDDPDIICVEDGVLTAKAVGTTTIRATYEDRQAECTAGCLAETEEELKKLSYDILCQPKRLLPEVDLTAECTAFDDAAIVGDSITYMMMLVANKEKSLGDVLFLTRGGTSLSGFVMRSKNVYFRGKELNLEDAIAKSGVKRMYILIGSNDIGSPTQKGKFFSNWDTLLERLREKSPELEIVIISNIPKFGTVVESKKPRFIEYNDTILEYNEKLKEYCREKDCFYLDLYAYTEDHCGRMAKLYNRDGFHMNDKGNTNWIKVLRYYANFELEGGTLS